MRRERVVRNIVLERKNRRPLTRRNVFLRLREIYDLLDPKCDTQLTEDDVELINYNFLLARLYDELSARGEVRAIGFEADYDEDEEEDEEDPEDDGDEDGDGIYEIYNKQEAKRKCKKN